MCWGYSQSSLVGAKTATLLLPAHLESRLSGSAERLTPSLLPSPHPSIHPSASAAVSPPPSSTVCVAAGAQLKFKLQHSLFPLSHSLFSALVSFSLLSPSCPTSNTSDEGQNSRNRKNMYASWSACGRHHRGDCYSSPSENWSLSVHWGTLQ